MAYTFKYKHADTQSCCDVLRRKAHATPRLMVVNGSPCKYCRIIQTPAFLKEHERSENTILPAFILIEDPAEGVTALLRRVSKAPPSRALSARQQAILQSMLTCAQFRYDVVNRLCIVLMESQGLGPRNSGSGASACASGDTPGSAGSSRGMFARAVPLPAVGYAPAPEILTKLHMPADLIGAGTGAGSATAGSSASTQGGGRTATPPRPPDSPRRPGSGSKVPTRPSSRRSKVRVGGSSDRAGSGSSLGRSSLGSRGSGGGGGGSRTSSPALSSGGDDSDGSAAEPPSGVYTEKELSAIAAGKTAGGKKSLFGKLKISESSPLAASKRPKPKPPPRGHRAGGGSSRPKRPPGASHAPGAARRTPAPSAGGGGSAGRPGAESASAAAAAAAGLDLGLTVTSTAIRPN